MAFPICFVRCATIHGPLDPPLDSLPFKVFSIWHHSVRCYAKILNPLRLPGDPRFSYSLTDLQKLGELQALFGFVFADERLRLAKTLSNIDLAEAGLGTNLP